MSSPTCGCLGRNRTNDFVGLIQAMGRIFPTSASKLDEIRKIIKGKKRAELTPKILLHSPSIGINSAKESK